MYESTRGLAAAATLAVMTATLAVAGAAHAADSSAPPSTRNVVTDTYHGLYRDNCFAASRLRVKRGRRRSARDQRVDYRRCAPALTHRAAGLDRRLPDRDR